MITNLMITPINAFRNEIGDHIDVLLETLVPKSLCALRLGSIRPCTSRGKVGGQRYEIE